MPVPIDPTSLLPFMAGGAALGFVGLLGLVVGAAVTLNSIGSEATLEGRKARSFPLRFADGAVLFGPVKVGQVPPLF